MDIEFTISLPRDYVSIEHEGFFLLAIAAITMVVGKPAIESV